MLRVTNLTHAYPDNQETFKDVHLRVHSGETVALLGQSGSGKTTFLKTIAGIESVTSGEVFFGSRLFSSSNFLLPPQERNIGFVFQDYALFPHLNVVENIRFGLFKRPKKEQIALAQHWARKMRLCHRVKNLPHQLSGGERQRLAIARALAPSPSLLLMDEPFCNLDASLRSELQLELKSVLLEENITTLLVTHSYVDATALASRVVQMKSQSIMEVDSLPLPQNVESLPKGVGGIEK